MNRTLVTNHQELGDPVSDDRLSWAARGLYAWMERYRPDLIAASQQAVCDVAALKPPSKAGRGRDAIASSLRELRRFGYLPPLKQTSPTDVLKGKPGFVYLVRASNGLYKIGASRNPQQRLKGIRFTLKSPSAELIHTISTSDMGSLEESLHQQFASYRLASGFEMFDLPPSAVAEICAMKGEGL